MKIRSSHLAFAIIAMIGAIVALALIRSSQQSGPKSNLGSTDKFLSQVNKIRETGGGSSVRDGIIPGAQVDFSKMAELEFSESPVNMGTIARTGKAEKRITIKNPGDLPITVLDVQTSCACTWGRFEEAVVGANGKTTTDIGPHREATFIVSVDPARVNGFHSSKVLTLTTNDPVTTQYTLNVISYIDPEFSMEPAFLDFGTVQRGTPAEVHATIRQLMDEPLEIKSVQVPSPKESNQLHAQPAEPPVTMELMKRPQSEWQNPIRAEWDLIARLSPTVPPGSLHQTFWVITDAKRVTDFAFEIDGKVESFFTVSPAALGARSAAAPGQSRVAEATVSASIPITITDVKVTGDDLVVEVVPQTESNTLDILLSVSPDAKPGLKNEVVSFTVSGGERPSQHTMRAYVSVQSQAPAAQ